MTQALPLPITSSATCLRKIRKNIIEDNEDLYQDHHDEPEGDGDADDDEDDGDDDDADDDDDLVMPSLK